MSELRGRRLDDAFDEHVDVGSYDFSDDFLVPDEEVGDNVSSESEESSQPSDGDQDSDSGELESEDNSEPSTVVNKGIQDSGDEEPEKSRDT
ncbi:hypothetical protein ACEPPN_018401 [Leptodophora sp. 'Broadleaf-Isolate-01']